jgi:hypothetical protein
MAVLEVGREPAAESEAARFTETTRLLCAAAYTEATFAQEVVEELVDEDYRAVAVPPGVDPEPVIKHCLAALGQKRLRDRVLAGNLLLALLLLLFGGASLEAGIPLVWVAVAYYLVSRFGHKRVLGALLVVNFVMSVLILLYVGGVMAIVLLVAWVTVAYDLWSSTYGVVTKRLNVQTFDPAAAPAVASAELEQRIAEIVERHAGNLTVYSGFLPFASSGSPVGGWSFVIDLRKGKEEFGERLEPERVQPLDLYRAVERALEALGMSNLTIEDRVFVHGVDIRDDRVMLPAPIGRPSSSVPDAELRQLMIAPTNRVRHYTCIRVTDWRGQLVLSLYLRFGIANERLFCEMSSVLLTPLKPELHRSDNISPEPELGDLGRLMWRSLISTPVLWLRSPAAVLRSLLRQRRRATQLQRVKRNAFFDYGSPETALDRARLSDYTRYFQILDKQMYVKVLERTILDSIVDVLEEHNIDPGEIVERRDTIINYGIMARAFHAGDVAVGDGAMIVKGGKPSSADSGSGSGSGGS